MELIDKEATFNFGLDSRLIKAISKMGIEHPTLVQLHGIPLALKGIDILARARTGSGKTLAYLLPILQKILNAKLLSQEPSLRAIILVPTVELCKQVLSVLNDCIYYCSNEIKCIHISSDTDVQIQKSSLAQIPDILIATPGRITLHLKSNNLTLQKCEMMVIDEADLILSYGHKTDIDLIVQNLPEGTQSLLMSATLNKDVDQLKSLVLHNPAILKLEAAEVQDKLSQYSIKVESDFDKYLTMYVLLKLKIIRGKGLIFVNNIERCFKLKIFLERLSIKTALLNSELPQNSRIHILSEFNRGFFDYLIATDENFLEEDMPLVPDVEEEEQAEEQEEGEGEGGEGEEKPKKREKRKREKKAKKSGGKGGKGGEEENDGKEYGVTRGIDFKGVGNVINFDFPTEPKNYVHRAGRTARGGGSGNVVSIYRKPDEDMLEEVQEILKEESRELKPFDFAPELCEGFRYRCSDVYNSITKSLIQQARIKELKTEILNSKKLKAHFEDNPIDLEMLKHDNVLTNRANFSHLKHLPLYLQPDIRTTSVLRSTLNNKSSNENYRHKKHSRSEMNTLTDPLKSFNYETPQYKPREKKDEKEKDYNSYRQDKKKYKKKGGHKKRRN